MHRYSASGLAVESEVRLPAWVGREDDRPADVVIRNTSVPRELDEPTWVGPTWQIAGDRFLLTIPDLARFMIEDGRAISFETEGDTSPDDLGAFLTGSVFGILLHQRGQLVLHASSVVVDGRAVLFCGVSGAGKSTLAAALSKRGYAIASDDLCAVTVRDGQAWMRPDGRQLKLWQAALDGLALGELRGEQVRHTIQKYYIATEANPAAELPIAAIYSLAELRGPNEPGITRPNIVDSARALIQNAFRPLIAARLGQRQDYFEAGVAIGSTGCVFHLVRPLRFEAMDATIGWLEDHWRELGLLPERH